MVKLYLKVVAWVLAWLGVLSLECYGAGLTGEWFGTRIAAAINAAIDAKGDEA